MFPEDLFSTLSPSVLKKPYCDYTMAVLQSRCSKKFDRNLGLSTPVCKSKLMDEGLYCWEIGWIDAAKRRPMLWRVSIYSKDELEKLKVKAEEADVFLNGCAKTITNLTRCDVDDLYSAIGASYWYRGIEVPTNPGARIRQWVDEEITTKLQRPRYRPIPHSESEVTFYFWSKPESWTTFVSLVHPVFVSCLDIANTGLLSTEELYTRFDDYLFLENLVLNNWRLRIIRVAEDDYGPRGLILMPIKDAVAHAVREMPRVSLTDLLKDISDE